MMDLMGNEVIETEAREVLPDADRAHIVHGEILAGKKQVAMGLYELAAGLKAMRDEKLYIPLGCVGFDEYCERLAKVNVSQAYKYIKVYEELGATVLQSTGGIGIEKLFLVTQLPPSERGEAIAEPETIEGMSVKELKDFVAKARQQGEQLSLMQGEIDELTRGKEDAESRIDELSAENREKSREVAAEYEEKLARMQEKLDAVKKEADEAAAAADRAVEEKIKAEKERLAKEAEVNARLKVQLEIEEARKQGEAEAAKKAEEEKKALAEEKKKAEDALDALKKEVGGRDERIAGLEKKLRNADSAVAAFRACLEGLLAAYERCTEYAGKIENTDERERCKTALARAVERMRENG